MANMFLAPEIIKALIKKEKTTNKKRTQKASGKNYYRKTDHLQISDPKQQNCKRYINRVKISVKKVISSPERSRTAVSGSKA